jgi:AraC family transcriptional regulator of adaptative response/methylated-DNA-[protein]-cysteine methyltransferase
MNEQQSIDYSRIAAAIDYIRLNFKDQPNLDEVASRIHLSPSHFQRLFTEWAGTSPKKFLQYISVQHAKKMLLETPHLTLFDAALETGLSGTSRLHDLFINIEGMTPGEYKNGGSSLSINYSFTSSPFGSLLIASTSKGVCHIAFQENELTALQELQTKFPHAAFSCRTDAFQLQATSIFDSNQKSLRDIKLHLKGTNFQIKVWESLLRIPFGKMTTYGAVAAEIGSPSASRAVGTAIGSNPIAFLIPCHRVIQATGALGGYMWGSTRKAAIIGWEAALSDQQNSETARDSKAN